MASATAAILCLAAFLATASALNTTCFTNSGAVLETAGNPNFVSASAVFNEKIHNVPAAVAYAHTQQQVQDIIRCAHANGMKAVPRGGGHGYEGYAVQNGSITVDISNLTSFTVSSDGSSVTFGSGFRLGDLALTMYEKANSLIPAGTCPWVGSSGQILGGGTGLSVRSYGLACDQLLGVTMVDYQGNVIQASSTQNQKLLWASCGGGGGNLGIVTSFIMKTNSLKNVPYVTTGTLSWSGYNSSAAVFDKAQRFFPSSDHRMNAQLLIGFGSTSINVQWFGNASSLQQQLQMSGLLNIPGCQASALTQESFINATLRWGAGTMNIPNNTIQALNMTSVPPAAEKNFTAGSSYNQNFMSMQGIQTMVNAIANIAAGEQAFVEHKMLGGAMAQRNNTDTAFYFRNSLYETQWFYFWSSADQTVQSNTWLQNTKTAMAPYVGQGNYINYVDPLLAASNAWPEAYYGGNLQAYRAVKTMYDPTNYFNNPLTPPPLSGSATAPGFVSASMPTLPGQAQAPSPKSGIVSAGRR